MVAQVCRGSTSIKERMCSGNSITKDMHPTLGSVHALQNCTEAQWTRPSWSPACCPLFYARGSPGKSGAHTMFESGARIGDYEIWGRIGGGGMGDVWLARHVL